MTTLRETVYNSIIKIHRETNKEWIPLKEIYKEVGKKKLVKNGGASIRATLETHSKLSDAFSGPEEYILKEKGSGLYKSIYYDHIKNINNINIGDIFTREELMALFKISGQSGIMKTNSLNCLVLTTSEENGVYADSKILNGNITYTGEGLLGDQTLTKNNKTLYESNENDIPIYLFSKDENKRYVFEGRVKLCNEPYQVLENDIEGKERLVWKFPLSIIYPDNNVIKEDENLDKVISKLNEIENEICSNLNKNDILDIREGKVKIRKYRKTNRKNERSKKPNYLANEIIKYSHGTINEQKVFDYECKELLKVGAKEQVEIMKDFYNNRKDNEGYDILSFELNEDGEYVKKYIEVKSTTGNEGTPIDITRDEVYFAKKKKNINHYYIYRIINSDSEDCYLKIIKGTDLFKDYKLVSTSYKIYSK